MYYVINRNSDRRTIYKNGKETSQAYFYKSLSIEDEKEILRITEEYYKALDEKI